MDARRDERESRAEIDTQLSRLDRLIRRGRQLRDAFASDPRNEPALASTRVWQQDCAATINQLSGGSKSHWLARAYSEAFLIRSTPERLVEEGMPAEIVDRIVGALESAAASLIRMGTDHLDPASSEAASRPRRFEFVHNPELRPIVEQAYWESLRAFDQGRYGLALVTSCGLLEAIVTDALEHKGSRATSGHDTPAGAIADWSFEARLVAAERVGLIRSGWVRLPPVARRYQELVPANGGSGPDPDGAVSERDARVAGQVLHVLMRDLNPGR